MVVPYRIHLKKIGSQLFCLQCYFKVPIVTWGLFVYLCLLKSYFMKIGSYLPPHTFKNNLGRSKPIFRINIKILCKR